MYFILHFDFSALCFFSFRTHDFFGVAAALADFRGSTTVLAQRHCTMDTGQVYGGGSSRVYSGQTVEHGVFLIKGTAVIGVHGSKDSLTQVLTLYQLCPYS